MKTLVVLALLLSVGVGYAGADTPSCSPNELVLSGGSGQTTQLGKPFAQPLQVRLASSTGCQPTGNLAGVDVTFTVQGTGAGGLFASTGSSVASIETDEQGTATAPQLTANDTVGNFTVVASSPYGSVTLPLAVTAAGVPAAITMSSAGTQLKAHVTDANGNPVQGAQVTFGVVPGASGASATFVGGQPTATTDAAGNASSPPLARNGVAGTFTVTASVDGVANGATYTLRNKPSKVSLVASRRQTATVGTNFRPLSVRVLQDGRPVEGATVQFTIAPSSVGAGGAFAGGATQATATTDANGRAVSPVVTANTSAGSFSATASTSGSAVTFALTNRAAKPASLTAGAASGEQTTVGSRFAVPLAVTVVDAHNNPVKGATVTFTAPRHGASGHFKSSSRVARVVTNGKGIAVAPRFTANGKAGGYAVTAAVKGAGRVAFALVNEPRS